MKNLFSLLIILFFFISCKTQYDVVRKIDNEHRYAPPGTIWIKDSIYIDQTEISNMDYLEYVTWLYVHDTLLYKKALPDTAVWRAKQNYNEPYVEYYFRHPAYRGYPVVGVSYEQAVDYCIWRTERVKEFSKLIKPKSKFASSYKNKNYHYRLPTKEEWEYAASAGNGRTYGFEKLQTKENTPNFNLKETYALGYVDVGADITVPVLHNKPNSFGLYNTIGNVAEMTMEKGISKGGGWINSITECEISDSIKYEKSSSWLGFRCVCVVTK